MKRIAILFGIIGLLWSCKTAPATEVDQPLFTFGLIADCQYCNAEDAGKRKYRKSPQKLRESVAELNKHDLEFTMHLGDFIDKDWASYDTVLPIYNQLKDPHYFTLGNHEFSVADSLKHKILGKLNMQAPNYEFSINKWRFIVLNGNEISLYAYPKTSERHKAVLAYYDGLEDKPPVWNGGLAGSQINWLKETLEESAKMDEKVILFCHFPINAENPSHNLWNAPEVLNLVAQYPQVKAYINGHNHAGGYDPKDGIHHLTMKGMLDTDSTAYGRIKVFQDRLELVGYGRQDSIVMPF